MRNKLRNYLSKEIAIEYKACLYFCYILFFYLSYLLCTGRDSASILFMFEMIITTYFVGYLQVYFLRNFDESEWLGRREAAAICLCSGIYGLVSLLLNWFERKFLVTVIFFGYFLLCYICVYLCNKVKRKIDTERLNVMLTAYKECRQYEKGEDRKDIDSGKKANGGGN